MSFSNYDKNWDVLNIVIKDDPEAILTPIKASQGRLAVLLKGNRITGIIAYQFKLNFNYGEYRKILLNDTHVFANIDEIMDKMKYQAQKIGLTVTPDEIETQENSD